MKTGWQAKLRTALPADWVLRDPASCAKYSKDYFHFSPVLVRELGSHVADCIVRPLTDDGVSIALAIAAEYHVPVTVRGSGTGNYGQAVPLQGGIVLDMSGLNAVLEIEDNQMRAQAGARMGRMETAAREQGLELRVFPSTFQTATIGGFISGGSGGIGSITWGSIWEDLVTQMRVKTAEPVPRDLTIEGSDVQPFVHNYGTAGVVTDLTIRLAPRSEWVQRAVTFDDWTTAYHFGMALANDTTLSKRLLSIHEWPMAAYFTPLNLSHGCAVALIETDVQHEPAVLAQVSEWGGIVEFYAPPAQYHRGTGVSDFTWNHTTLWARKNNPSITYLQARFSVKEGLEQMATLKAEYPELCHHVELIKDRGRLTVAALPILQFSSEARLNALMERCESIGVSIANPHTCRLEFGGRTPLLQNLLDMKRQNDPFGLLNPGKLAYYSDAASQVQSVVPTT